MSDELDLILELVSEQAPALLAVDGVVYEGHIQSCHRGTVVAVARSVGSRQPRAEYRWALADVQFARQVEPRAWRRPTSCSCRRASSWRWRGSTGSCRSRSGCCGSGRWTDVAHPDERSLPAIAWPLVTT
jgi:hypothetical protein